jgi:hypothetical protein
MPSKKARVKKLPSRKKKCLHCTKKAVSRDLCDTCRISLFGKIRLGELTEQEAIDKGWIAPLKQRGRKPECGFAKTFEAARRNGI